MIERSRGPDGAGRSHIMAYANTAGATEAHALFGLPQEIIAGLQAPQTVGVRYVLINAPARQSMHRFAAEVMPAFPQDCWSGVDHLQTVREPGPSSAVQPIPKRPPVQAATLVWTREVPGAARQRKAATVSGTQREECLTARVSTDIDGYPRERGLTVPSEERPANTHLLVPIRRAERLDRTQEVGGSSPPSSMISRICRLFVVVL